MKTTPFKLILASCLITVTFIMCNKDDDEATTSDPNVFCNESFCATNDVKKQQCIEAFNTCMANNPDANDDECVATALLICN